MNSRKVLRHRAVERGSVFLLSIVVLTVLLVLGASLMEKAQTAVYRTSVSNRGTQSFHLAEAGVQRALWALRQPNGWLTYGGESRIALPGGFVDVSVSPPPSARGVFTDRVTVLATGYLPGPNGAKRHSCTVRAITHKDPRYFEFAVFGTDGVTIGNGIVSVLADSYSSDNGEYGGANVSESADVGTNSTAAGAVKILPQGEVHGNVCVGWGAVVPSACVDNKGLITGTVSALDSANQLPSITSWPAGAVELGDVWLDGSKELVLGEGTYHMTDLDISGSARIVCNGKVVIYIDETSDMSTPDIRIGGNGIVNTSRIPANLILYCASDVTNIAISGNGQFYGGIYAPNAAITLNAGDLYGAVVGRTVTLNGATAKVHYDKALRDHANPNPVVRSWEVF